MDEILAQSIIDNSVRVQNLTGAQSQDFLQTLWTNQNTAQQLETLNVIFPNRVFVEENGDFRIIRSVNDAELMKV